MAAHEVQPPEVVPARVGRRPALAALPDPPQRYDVMLTNEENRLESISLVFLERLEKGDPSAWLEFFHKIYATARGAIDNALAARDLSGVKEARRLVRAYQDDPADVHVALDLAWTSFQSHFLDRTKSRVLKTEADCAALLIRVAYNRWQRERYRERQVRRQMALGAASSDGPSLIEQYSDLGPGPEDEVDLADFQAALDQEVIHFTQHLSDVDRKIVYMTYFERKTPREIKEQLGVSQAKSQDVPRLWRLHLLQRYPKTLDFLGPEPDQG
jgi:DNA-directed RNA polymerase specialized sigma24 family protein